MSSEPEIGVEYGAQHLHRVAAERKIVGNKKRNKTSQRGHEEADPDPINSLQNHAQNHHAPADKNRRGIKVGYRRAALQHHSEYQTCRVDEPRDYNDVKGRTPQ